MESRYFKSLIRLIKGFCKPEFIEEIEGDLTELYIKRLKVSKSRANLLLLKDVLLSFRFYNLKGVSIESNFPILISYLTTGYRNLKKDIGYTVINLAGLSVALCLFILMITIESHERSFDKFHTNSDRVFQVIQVFQNADGDDPEIFTSLLLADALESELTSVEKAVSVHGAASTWVKAGEKQFFEEDGIVAGKNFFKLFDYTLLHGDKKALDNAYSIVISETLANKYFNKSNCIGQVIELERYGSFTITAVMKDVPSNSTMQFNFILTQNYETYFTKVASWFPPWFQSWSGDPAATFVLLRSPDQKQTIEKGIGELVTSHILDGEISNVFYLVSLNDLHYGLHGVDGRINKYRKGDKTKSTLLILVAIIVLAMGCFNYLNIITARLSKRSREVGLRKAIGAYRSQISTQFLTESFLLVTLATVFGIILAYYLTPAFSTLAGIPLSLSTTLLVRTAPYIFGVILLMTFLAGAYPAFYLGRMATTQALKISNHDTSKSSFIRNVIVTTQFGFALAMAISLGILNQQYNYMREKDLGFDSQYLAVVEINGAGVRSNYDQIKNELLKESSINSVTGVTRMISGYRSGARLMISEFESSNELISTGFYGMDSDGPSVLGLELIHGTSFTGNNQQDSTSVILNKTAADKLGGLAVVGKDIELIGDGGDKQLATVIGIVKDFHTESLHEAIGPVVVGYLQNPFQSLDDIVVKVDGERIFDAIAAVENVHNTYDENNVITLEFLDDMINRSYEDEANFRNVLMASSVLGLLIAILGTIGLTAYMSESRSKEIGVRKVLGASVKSILVMQSRSFINVIVIAVLIVCPLIWLLANEWLSQYAYRIELSIFSFSLTVLAFVALTIFTTILISFKASIRNPASSLRTE